MAVRCVGRRHSHPRGALDKGRAVLTHADLEALLVVLVADVDVFAQRFELLGDAVDDLVVVDLTDIDRVLRFTNEHHN